ncbi:MAG TPA: DNA repair protein RadA [Thermoanaerobaculaceae bacterium]|nr:DNA repair protein RadA [Thermoanaerobaculaceae bacterium]HRS15696.1 DNA repair protein RadA [Thermoanaerobaculaceae bacterium]
MGRDTLFECTACGQQSSKWLGKCPTCGGWNTFEQVPDRPRAGRREVSRAAAPVSLSDAELRDVERISTGLPGLDRVLGGGLVPGSAVLLAGEPGIGKSTLLLQTAARLAAAGPVLYVTAEESPRQVALRAHRLGCVHPQVLLHAEPVVEEAIGAAQRLRPRLVVADSVQTMLSERVPAVAGSVTQVREVASQLVELAKRDGPPVVMVGHVTKEGMVAGPKALEHMVDAVLEFGGVSGQPQRVLRAAKNRFGPTQELALLTMGDHGLDEVPNASAALLADRRTGASGSAVAVAMEGATPLLVEVQALVARSPLVAPRRVAQGMDAGRLAVLLAVLEKRANLRVGDRDVFVNLAGGVTVDEPALDAAVAAAVISAAADIPVPPDLAFFGEVGLLGEIRTVSHAAERLREAESLGFGRCAVPAGTPAPRVGLATVPLEGVGSIVDLVRC